MGNCFKISFDIDLVDLNQFIEQLSSIGDVILNDELYIWTNDNIDSQKLSESVRAFGVSDFFCKKVLPFDVEGRQDFVETWYKEKYNAECLERFESGHQAELKKMINNIEEIKRQLQGGNNGRQRRNNS